MISAIRLGFGTTPGTWDQQTPILLGWFSGARRSGASPRPGCAFANARARSYRGCRARRAGRLVYGGEIASFGGVITGNIAQSARTEPGARFPRSMQSPISDLEVITETFRFAREGTGKAFSRRWESTGPNGPRLAHRNLNAAGATDSAKDGALNRR